MVRISERIPGKEFNSLQNSWNFFVIPGKYK
jgi:hypothetical protein